MKTFLQLMVMVLLLGCNVEKEKTVTRNTVLVELAKKDILKNLKAPSTAQFVDSTARVVQLRNNYGEGADGNLKNEYSVKLEVDAQNGFGAMLRDSYRVVYEYNGTDSLSPDSYKFLSIY